jgi:hypothetical protein
VQQNEWGARKILTDCLRTACERAGLQRIDWHTLRHTHGSLLHSQGTPLKVAQAQLGHAHMATYWDVYTHASVTPQRDARNLLEGQLFSNVPRGMAGIPRRKKRSSFSQQVVGAWRVQLPTSCAQG